ncbi:glycosyltransferase [Fulvivirga sp. 29W222]|uniref:Glycosyltransferase n=1 Tax=Fulvivirga marina TaxID=2494733 RepID=A0A937KDC5_9BACT|nr:glycosyltransferase [Fulvivirga marina]MBL6448324.1 glycosyltransferase [Fulvivirga marina]
MYGLAVILIIICVITVIIDLLLILFWYTSRQELNYSAASYPKVSVLVAARNEEHNIKRCINALLNLNYPADKLEIWIGDDSSEDHTLREARKFADNYSHIHVVEITGNLGNARGKANVLAHLARQARGNIYFITDADIAVNKDWIVGMLCGLKPGVGIVNGVTAVEDHSLQNVDWLFAIGMVKVITDLGKPVTAIGNNMCVTKEAYESVGGYENIPFSITEDFELFKQVKNKGFVLVQLMKPDVLARTKSIRGVKNLLNQRKRWMFGAVQLPVPVVSMLTFQALFHFSILPLLFIHLYFGGVILLLKIVIQTFFVASVHNRLKLSINWTATIFYDLYAFGLSLLSSIYFLIPTKVRWKGRKY